MIMPTPFLFGILWLPTVEKSGMAIKM